MQAEALTSEVNDSFPLSSIVGIALKRRYRVPISALPCGLCVVDQGLWSCQEDGICIFNEQLVLQRHIPAGDMDNICDVAQWREGEFIVAAWNGLFHITANGERLHQIASGLHSGVSVHANKLYAVRWFSGFIDVYELKTSWQSLTSINVPKDYVTLRVCRKDIVACFRDEHAVHIYSHSGQLINVYGMHGKRKPGELKEPRVHYMGDDGTLLISDSDNRRLQLLTNERQWHIVQLWPFIERPHGAVWLQGKLFLVSDDKMIGMFSP